MSARRNGPSQHSAGATLRPEDGRGGAGRPVRPCPGAQAVLRAQGPVGRAVATVVARDERERHVRARLEALRLELEALRP